MIGCHRKARRNLDQDAIDIDVIFAAEMTKMSDAFMAAHPVGVFVTYKFNQPAHINPVLYSDITRYVEEAF